MPSDPSSLQPGAEEDEINQDADSGVASPSRAETPDGDDGAEDGGRSEPREPRAKSREELLRKYTSDAAESAEDGGTEQAPDTDAGEVKAEDAPEATTDEQLEGSGDEAANPESGKPAEETPDEAESEDAPDEEAEVSKVLGRVPDEVWRKLPAEGKARINALRTFGRKVKEEVEALRTQAPLADYASKLLAFTEKEKISDDDFATWVELAAVVNRGGKPAIDELLGMAQALGWKPEAAKVEDAALPDWLQAKVDAAEMTEEAAREVVRRSGAPRTEKPVERPEAPRFGGRGDPSLEAGKKILATKQAEALRKYGSQWPKLWASVQKEMLRHKGTPPEAWASLFDLSLKVVVGRNATAPKKIGKQPLEAGSGRAPGRGEKPDFSKLSGRDRLVAKYG
jgi:hypothetical protein